MNLNWARLAKFIAAYGVFFATTGEVIDRLTILELSDASNTIFQWTTLAGLPLVIALATQGNLTNLTASVKGLILGLGLIPLSVFLYLLMYIPSESTPVMANNEAEEQERVGTQVELGINEVSGGDGSGGSLDAPRSVASDRIGVFPFEVSAENEPLKQSLHWGLSSSFAAKLRLEKQFDVYHKSDIQRLQSMGFSSPNSIGLANWRDIAQRNSYKYFLTGSAAQDTEQIKVKYSIHRTENMEPVWQSELTAPLSSELIDSIGASLEEALQKQFAENRSTTKPLPLSTYVTDRYEAFLEHGKAQFELEWTSDFRLAKESLKRAVAIDNRYARAWFLLYSLVDNAEDPELAKLSLVQANRALDRLVPEESFQVRLAFFQFIDTNPPAVMRIVEEWVESYPNFPYAWSVYAFAMEESGKLEKAEAGLRALIKLLPANNPEGYQRLGALELKRGYWDSAVELFNAAVAIKPDDPFTWEQLAHSHRMVGDLERARDALTKMVSLDSTMVSSILTMSEFLACLGEFSEAEDSISMARIFATTPQDEIALSDRETQYFRFRGKVDAQLQSCDEFSTKQLPWEGELRQARIDLYCRIPALHSSLRWPVAKQKIENVARILNTESELGARGALVDHYVLDSDQQGLLHPDLSLVAEQMLEWLKDAPYSPQRIAHDSDQTKADVFSVMGEYAEARNAFERLIQRDPDHLNHYHDYAQMLAAMGNHSEALVQLNTALAYCPFEPEWNLEAAASYLALEDFERAQAFIAVAAESLSGADETALSSVRLQTLRQNLSQATRP
jgi:tetratricopeptide (TPR) repeat protein/TolB-like protein